MPLLTQTRQKIKSFAMLRQKHVCDYQGHVQDETEAALAVGSRPKKVRFFACQTLCSFLAVSNLMISVCEAKAGGFNSIKDILLNYSEDNASFLNGF